MSKVGASETPAAAPAPEPGAAPARSPRRALVIAGIVLATVALGTRFYRLGPRPLHHDESIHAFQSYTLARDGTWRYDPAYHGPFLYYANALVYKLFGASNTTARLLPAVFGLILIGLAWPLSRWIGKEAAAAYAVLVLLSPHDTYFSRFIREDLYSLVFTLGTILAFRMFLDTNRARWLTLSAVSFALAGVTKENAYMTGVLFVAFGFWSLADRVWADRPIGPAFSTALKKTFEWSVARWRPLATAALVFLSIWVLFYTAFGRYREDWLAIPKAVKYWMGQHSIARIPGPWYYYVPQLLYYETAICFAAAFAFRDRTRWRDPFYRFLVFWTIGSFAIYAWAREKVPWLTVHPLLPITILGAIGCVNLWHDRRGRLTPWAIAVFLLLLTINTSGMILACFRYAAYDLEKEPRHGEYLAYVQTTWDLLRGLDWIEKAKPRVAPGQSVVTYTGEATWPLSWYLRDAPATWVPALETASTPLIIADWNPEGTLEKQLADKYTSRRLPIRAWWFPDDFWRRSVSERLRWWLFHQLWNHADTPADAKTPIGSQDSVLYIRKDLIESGAPLSPLQIAVRETSSRDYGAPPKMIPGREIGSQGSGPGQFNEPRGIAVDPRGNIYVADTKNNRIQILTGDGQPLKQFGSKGSGPGQFNEPCGLSVDARGEIWVADTWNYRIVHLAGDGRFLGAFGGPNMLFGPRTVLASGNVLYVADTGNKRIARYDREGNKLSEWGGNGSQPGQFVEPVGLAQDAAGNIYVADTGNHRVQVFDSEGRFQRQFPVSGWKDFYTEPHIAVGPSETVFVTDSWGNRIAQYDSSGALQRSFRPEQDAKQPTGIAIDPFGRLIVSDRGTHRLFSWDLSAIVR